MKKSQPIPISRNSHTILPQNHDNGIQANHVNNGHRYAEEIPNGPSGSGSYVISGASLKWHQFCGLVIKRFYQTRRNLKGLFSQIFLPSFFITIAMVFALSVPKPKDAPPLALNTGMFDRPNYVPFANENSSDTLAVGMETTLKLPSGLGSFCYVRNPSDHTKTWSYSSNPCKSKIARQDEIKGVLNQQCLDKVYSHVRLCKNDTMLPDPAHHGTERRKNTTHCYCSDNRLKYSCPVSRPAPKEFIPATLDTLRNVSGRDVMKYLLYSTDKTVMARSVLPSHLTISSYHLILPSHLTISSYHLTLPSHLTISSYHLILPSHLTISSYHLILPSHLTISSYHLILPSHLTISSYHLILPSHLTISSYHLILPSHLTISSYHLILPPHLTISYYHCCML